MLIRNKKFDMRAYVLVTGMNPLKIYFYKDGYLKIPVKNFTLDHDYIKMVVFILPLLIQI